MMELPAGVPAVVDHSERAVVGETTFKFLAMKDMTSEGLIKATNAMPAVNV